MSDFDNKNVPPEEQEGRIIDVALSEEMEQSFLDYSMSVIVQRALPDVRDGLKPVHRRILYQMYQDSLWPDSAYRKCMDTVGKTLASWHPHGDASVYDALVRLAQDFSLRYMLVDGHGNFGSVDGDPPAAPRYTEARMTKLSVAMLDDINKDTVDFQPNYDDRLKEPTVLPSHFPNLLVNGSMGIAVGMATNVPPHNINEVLDGVCCMIDNPNATLDDLMEHIKGPDFPTGGIIMGRSGIRAAYATGRGKVVVRSRTEIEEEEKSGRSKIIVTEIPYKVNKAELIKSIADLVKDKRIDGITNIDDHSDREGMRIVIDVRRDASPQIVLNHLFSLTQMQISFGVIMLALVDGRPEILNLEKILKKYIEFQMEVITRRTQFDLKKAQDRAHILEGLMIALDFIDEVVAMLRAAKSIPEGKAALMERFDLDDPQAQAIVQMRLGQLTGLERSKVEEELEGLRAKIADLLDILGSEARRLGIIKDEAIDMKKRFGDERRTEIAAISGEVDIEDLIPVEECVLTLTRYGYVKRQKMENYRTQKRGGRGVSAMSRREEDAASHIFVTGSHDYVLFFSDMGRMYRVKCYEVPEGSRTSKGMHIRNLLPLQGDENITSVVHLSDLDDDKFLVMVTRRGVVKRTKLSAFNNVRKAGLIAVDLDEGDYLAHVLVTGGSDELIFSTRKGMTLCMREEDIRAMGRAARGVKVMRLGEGDAIVGMDQLRDGGRVLTVTETGFGRLSPIEDYRVQKRGGKGLKNYHVDKFGDVAGVKVVFPEEDIIMISSDGIIIRISAGEVRQCARPSKGVRVMRVQEGEKIVTLASAPKEETEETDTELETEQ
ncbi:DNA gyrase subunit A [Acutalibacter muris]|uniref:DNA gyrase subunit A n=1 Tax=Acutalibacter muris TaxID=1796620 RepID=A0A1Z2XL68_9FIRM|nr:DNA gyrase subunit A [Acutalibacter muris]ANU54134.1 DNA gyrase subunit A [Hungateiclostridiaceae bacterium KB18]ASB39181.1 DNA gyrase subunit A [Acutalibacter muris]QQR28469.1 DNA gyrase subunit A [Acutalibacter muris]